MPYERPDGGSQWEMGVWTLRESIKGEDYRPMGQYQIDLNKDFHSILRIDGVLYGIAIANRLTKEVVVYKRTILDLDGPVAAT